MAKICAVIFDLDNVLYDEKDYFYAAFQEIASYLSTQCNISQEKIMEKIVTAFKNKTSMYPRLFNDIVSDCGLDQKLVPEILKIFSNIKPNLKMFPESANLLLALKRLNIKLGLVTNGNVVTQKNKVELLQVAKFFDSIIYARDMEVNKEKPDPASYKQMINDLGVKPEEAICIGDNPFTDFLGAKKLGIRTVRLLGGEFKDVHLSPEYTADFTVTRLFDVYNIIVNDSCER